MKNIKQYKHIIIIIFWAIVIIIGGTIYGIYNQKQKALFKSYLSIAEQQFKDEDYKNAIESLTEAIKVNPMEPATYVLRAYSYYWNGQAAEALQDTDTHISLNENGAIESTADLFLLRGDIFMTRSQTDLALEAYSKAYTESTTDGDIVSGYVIALNVNREYEKAYNIIVKYFDELGDSVLWEDVGIDIWLARGMSAAMTHRCYDASTSAMRVINMTKEGDTDNNIAKGIFYNVMDDKKCINDIRDIHEK